MNICLFQPRYPVNPADSVKTTNQMIKWLEAADPKTDLIVLPEYSNCPGINNKEEIINTIAETTEPLLRAAREAAIRCHSLVCVSVARYENNLYRNLTYLYGTEGQLLTTYGKRHLTEFETTELGPIDTELFAEPPMEPVCINGVNYNLITCYDIYYPEYVQAVADGHVSLLVHPSYQRGERAEIITLLNRARAFDSGSFLIHVSYSMGEGSVTGGHSMITTPNGEIAAEFGQDVGCFYVELPELYRHTASSNFQGEVVDIKQQWEKARKPWLYRSGGSSYALHDSLLRYPRICAHRGLPVLLPENTNLSFGAAIALGVQEIELDLWASKDGVIIVSHDPSVDRLASNLTGSIRDLTYEEIMNADIGSKISEHLDGIKFSTFEEVLHAFAHRVIMNLHIKSEGEEPFDLAAMRKIVSLIDRYTCRGHVYIAGTRNVLEAASEVAPDIARCCLEGQTDYSLVENALRYDCKKLQLYKPFFTKEMIDKAHRNGMICNMFYSNDPEEAREFLALGVDTILTDNCAQIIRLLRE